MKKQRLKLEMKDARGFTLIEGLIALILIAIAAAVIFGGISTSKIAHAKNCENTLLTLQNWERQWEQSKQSGNPDVGLCRQLNELIDRYHGSFGNDFGNLPAVKCDGL